MDFRQSADPLPRPQQFVRDGQSGQSKPRRGHSGAGSGHNLVWPPTDHVILSPLFQSEPPESKFEKRLLGGWGGSKITIFILEVKEYLGRAQGVVAVLLLLPSSNLLRPNLLFSGLLWKVWFEETERFASEKVW